MIHAFYHDLLTPDSENAGVIERYWSRCCDYSLLCKITMRDGTAAQMRYGHPVTTNGVSYGTVVDFFRETFPEELIFFEGYRAFRIPRGAEPIDWLVPDVDAAALLAMKFA